MSNIESTNNQPFDLTTIDQNFNPVTKTFNAPETLSFKDGIQIAISVSVDKKMCWIKRLPDAGPTIIMTPNKKLDEMKAIQLLNMYPKHGATLYGKIIEKLKN